METPDEFTLRGGLVSIILIMFVENIYGAATMISFMPETAKDFINDTREVVGLITTIVILAIYIKKLLKDKKGG